MLGTDEQGSMYAVSYVPYFPGRTVDHQFGDFHIWNWNAHGNSIVSDNDVCTYLNRYFGLFKTSRGEPELRVAVFSQTDIPAIPSAEELKERDQSFGRFATALMACHLFNLPTDSDASWSACSADNFVAFKKTFDPHDTSQLPSFLFGSYRKMQVMGRWDELQFTTPQYMPDPHVRTCDQLLLQRLASITSNTDETVNRIFRSMDQLRTAFSNADWMEYPPRIIAMATAFEILLKLPERGKSKHLAARVNRLIPPNKLPTRTEPLGYQRRPVTDNEVGLWCRRFYALRSKIVHGEIIPPKSSHHMTGTEHLKISLNLYAECIRGLLIEHGDMTEDDRMNNFWGNSPWREQLALPDNVWWCT